MEMETVIAIIGYILAVCFPIIGVIYGLILYFAKGDDEYLKNHAKYILIVGVAMIIISLIFAMIFGFSILGMAAMG